MSLSVVFNNRNFIGTVSLPIQPIVKRYSWNMTGGPEKAYLSFPMGADMWDLFKLLRCGVEIYGGDGRLNWWGYVNRIMIPHGEQRIGMGLDMMFNSVVFTYGSGDSAADTAEAEDTESKAAYGIKEKKLFDSNATQAQAEQARSLYLAQHRFPPTEVEFSGGDGMAQIECYGWYQTLDWRYYFTSGFGDLDTSEQITNAVSSYAQFLAGSIVENTSGISTDSDRDGRQTTLTCINQLLRAGTTNLRPLLATVDPNRYLHLYERAAYPYGIGDYLLAPDGNLVTPLGSIVEPEHCICANWVQIKDTPLQNTANANVQAFFIEVAEYNAETDKCTYRPADAFEQVRLAKYIKDVIKDPKDPDIPPITTPTFAIDTYAYYTLQDGSVTSYTNTGVIYDVNDYSSGSAVNMTMTVAQDGLYMVGCDIWDNSGSLGNAVWCLIYGVTETNLAGSSEYTWGTYDTGIPEAAAAAVGVSSLSANDTLTIYGLANYSDVSQSAPHQFHWYVLKIA